MIKNNLLIIQRLFYFRKVIIWFSSASFTWILIIPFCETEADTFMRTITAEFF